MDNVKQLKERLIGIRDNHWNIPEDMDTYKLALEAMGNIGSTDGELRDDLILVFLWKLIIEKKLSKENLRELLDISLSDKHLFYKLGEREDDSVFNRAFTVLIVRWIIYYHNTYGEDLLNEEEVSSAFHKVINYVKKENDLRGFVEGKGWAHAMGHSGDALRVFALCNYIKHDDLIEILEIVKYKANVCNYVYLNEEMERLVSAVVNTIERKILSNDEVVTWVRSFEHIEVPKDYPACHYWKENIKDLLRSLYFRLKFRKAPEIIINEIEEVLNKINEFFNHIKE